MTTKTLNDQATKTKRIAYRAPETVEIDRTAHLVQGGGGGTGLDWSYYYYLDSSGM